ncbi:hypothetical protein CEE35_00160 [Candidatus Aerophobetes bacterium Ae_b3b]|nr:MAG: hypothetical protein CEE35_00160 [Candidatus Aerophobetes bacterium Ae_b3b]
MKGRKKIILLLGCMFIFTVSGFSIAGAQLPKIRVIMMSGSECDGMQKVAEAYIKETGNPVVVEGLGRGEYHAILPVHLFSASPGFDIAWIQNTWLAEYAEAGVLEPLDEFVQASEGYNIEDIFGVGRYKGKTYAIPTDVSTFFLFYRKDLIKEPPQTWKELLEVAKKFSKSQNPQSPTKYGITGDYITGEVLPQTWWNIMWSMRGEVIDKSGEVVVNKNGALEAGRYFEKLARMELVPPNLTQVGWDDHINHFVNGDAAMIVPGWNAAYTALPVAGGFGKYMKATLIPGVKQEDGSIFRTPYAHSWNFVIPAASRHKKAAWEFFKFATSKQGMIIYAKTGLGNPPRESVLMSPEMAEMRPDFLLMGRTLRDAGWFPPVTYFGKIFDALDVALAEIVNLMKSPKDALDRAARLILEAKKAAEY